MEIYIETRADAAPAYGRLYTCAPPGEDVPQYPAVKIPPGFKGWVDLEAGTLRKKRETRTFCETACALKEVVPKGGALLGEIRVFDGLEAAGEPALRLLAGSPAAGLKEMFAAYAKGGEPILRLERGLTIEADWDEAFHVMIDEV